ncbi:MAG: hypothetical protein O7D93_10705, partial [Acidobacteria bacterium]|nr:hypothetical protein [Acidobacteriota bacterium]
GDARDVMEELIFQRILSRSAWGRIGQTHYLSEVQPAISQILKGNPHRGKTFPERGMNDVE